MLRKTTTKKQLKAIAKNNATVTVKEEKKLPVTVKEGTPVSISEKTEPSRKEPLIGINKGITKNMSNYESLRVDVWCSDTLKESETIKEGLHRLNEVVDEVLTELVEEYL